MLGDERASCARVFAFEVKKEKNAERERRSRSSTDIKNNRPSALARSLASLWTSTPSFSRLRHAHASHNRLDLKTKTNRGRPARQAAIELEKAAAVVSFSFFLQVADPTSAAATRISSLSFFSLSPASSTPQSSLHTNNRKRGGSRKRPSSRPRGRDWGDIRFVNKRERASLFEGNKKRERRRTVVYFFLSTQLQQN